MSARLFVVLAAAGAGRRMSGDIPKQYLSLAGSTVVEWSLKPFLARDDIARIVVVLAPADTRFASLSVAHDSRVLATVGGTERVDSVARGLQALDAGDDDWVLVHDAARPCLQNDDLTCLISEATSDAVGGLLAVPVADTLKSADGEDRIVATISRENLWRAFTPQMFRVGILRRALHEALERGNVVTDEASAIELLGLQPKLIRGRVDNVKITTPEDLRYAEFILQQRLKK